MCNGKPGWYPLSYSHFPADPLIPFLVTYSHTYVLQHKNKIMMTDG